MCTHFIKLTSELLNTAKISWIDIQPNKYCIHIIDTRLEGFWIFTSGYFNGNQIKTMEICKETYPSDYQRLTEWINKTTF